MKIKQQYKTFLLNEREVLDAIGDFLRNMNYVEENDKLTITVSVKKGKYSAEVEARQP